MNKTEILKIAKSIIFNTEAVKAILDGRNTVTRRIAKPVCDSDGIQQNYKIPYYVGSILYVRETWQCLNPFSDCEIVYKASCDQDYASDIGKWLPSIHMPKKYARIFLKVTNARVERLQDITFTDCKKEGIKSFTKDNNLYKHCTSFGWWENFHKRNIKKYNFTGNYWQDMPKSITKAFSYLWDSAIDKKDIDKYGWKANPYVFVYEFETLEVE